VTSGLGCFAWAFSGLDEYQAVRRGPNPSSEWTSPSMSPPPIGGIRLRRVTVRITQLERHLRLAGDVTSLGRPQDDDGCDRHALRRQGTLRVSATLSDVAAVRHRSNSDSGLRFLARPEAAR
jgi:hypothetical protein